MSTMECSQSRLACLSACRLLRTASTSTGCWGLAACGGGVPAFACCCGAACACWVDGAALPCGAWGCACGPVGWDCGVDCCWAWPKMAPRMLPKMLTIALLKGGDASHNEA